jgi:hypothetical protein
LETTTRAANHQDPSHWSTAANLGAVFLRRHSKRLGHRAHAAAWVGQRPAQTLRLTRQAVEHGENAARRARTEIRAQHAIQGQSTLHKIRLESLLQDIGNIHSDDAQDLPHFPASKLANRPAKLDQREAVPAAAAAEPRRHGRQERLQGCGKAHKPPVERRQGGSVRGVVRSE